jgi:hypothetical protein
MLRRPSLQKKQNSPPFPKRPGNQRGNHSLTLRCHSAQLSNARGIRQMLPSEQMLFTMAVFGHVLIAGITLLIAMILDDPL